MLNFTPENSINHRYKKWNENNTKLTTCNPDSQTVLQPGMLHQDIDAGKDIVFTYDVTFEVRQIFFQFQAIPHFPFLELIESFLLAV